MTRRMRLPLSPTQVDHWMRQIDINGNGSITFHEFKMFAHRRAAELAAVFKRLDKDGAFLPLPCTPCPVRAPPLSTRRMH